MAPRARQAKSKARLQRFEELQAAFAAVFSPDGTRLASTDAGREAVNCEDGVLNVLRIDFVAVPEPQPDLERLG